jgi:hypothetical protein
MVVVVVVDVLVVVVDVVVVVAGSVLEGTVDDWVEVTGVS